jgi:hypothetical protein
VVDNPPAAVAALSAAQLSELGTLLDTIDSYEPE